MRLAGWILMSPTREMNQGGGGFRILVLGESTSAEAFADTSKAAWPRVLEKLLRDAGRDVKVINKALPATTTSLIVSHLSQQLDEIKPQLVISMMGVNDAGYTRFVGDPTAWNLFWNRIRLVKLVRSLVDQYQLRYRYPQVREGLPVYNLKSSEEGVFQRLSNQSLSVDQLSVEITDQDHPPCGEAKLLIDLVQRNKDGKSLNEDQTFSLLKRSLQLCPQYSMLQMLTLMEAREINNYRGCGQLANELFKFGRNLRDDVIIALADCYFGKSEVPEPLLDVMRYRGLEFGDPNTEDIDPSQARSRTTDKNYRRVYAILRSRAVPWIIMQYPTLPLQSRIKMFTEEEVRTLPIFFVSNEENFKKVLSEKPYDEVFNDRFARTWGHTTNYGHELIAHQVLPAVLQALNK